MKKLFTDRKFFEIFVLGIISGMPLTLIYSTFAAWLKEGNIGIDVITTFAIARMPYSFKFLWSPLIDYLKIPLLHKTGHRKSWLIVCCILTALILYSMSFINLDKDLLSLYLLAIVLGITSATYDINVDAFRIETFSSELLGQASAISVMGYRVGMLITGAGALELSYLFNSWSLTFIILSTLFILSAIFIFTIHEATIIREEIKSLSLQSINTVLIKPFLDFFTRKSAFLIFAVVILFKMGDAMIGVVSMPFYLELGFNKQQIALAVKVWGLVAILAGSYVGGWLIDRVGAFKGLMITGIIQALTHFAFIWLLYQGNHYPSLFIAIMIENIGCGMGSGALISYLSILCNKKYSATQYAFLSSAGSFFNNTVTIYAGKLVQDMGWLNYFLFTVALAFPALILLFYMNRNIKDITQDRNITST